MDKKKFYQNKILYALSKIDFALSRMNKKKNLHELSKIYQVLMTYGDTVKMEILTKMTGLTRRVIGSKLRELRAYGVIDWEGTYVTENTEIKSKVNLRDWYFNLMTKLKESGTKLDERDEKFLKEYTPKGKPISATIDIVDEEPVKKSGDWIEIPLEDGLVIKTTRKKLKEKLLG